LLFGQRAMKVKNVAKVNETIDYKALCLKLQSQLDSLEIEFREQGNDLEEMVEENDLLDKKVKQQEKELKQIALTLSKVEREKQALDSLVSGDLLSAEKKYNEMEEALKQRSEELTRQHKLELDALQRQIREKDTKLQEMAEDLAKREKDIENLSSELAEKTQAETDARENIDQLEKNLQDRVKQCCYFETALETSQSVVTGLENENGKLKGDLSAMKTNKDAIERINSELSANVDRLRTFESKLPVVEEERDEAHKKVASLQQEVVTLEDKCSSQQTLLKERQEQCGQHTAIVTKTYLPQNITTKNKKNKTKHLKNKPKSYKSCVKRLVVCHKTLTRYENKNMD
jgi:chromosome segregation ATPase